MKKNIIFLGALLLSSAAYSQVGINNETPKATLDVTAKTTDGSKPEGIIAPRLTGDQIKSADTQYDTPQIGTIVYATAAVGTSTPKTVNITSPGYYYFDNNLVWQKFGSGTAAVGTEPWYIQNTSTQATTNSQNIYQQGKVAVGFSNTDAVSGKQLEVKGDVKAVTNNAGTYSILETNNTDFGSPVNMMFSADNPNLIAATRAAIVSSSINEAALSAQGANGTSSVGATVNPSVGSKVEMSVGNSTTNILNKIVVGSNGETEQVDKIILRSENIPASTATRVLVDKAEGVTFKYGAISNPSGNYTFPQNNGTAGQVLVTNGALPTLTTGAQLSWQNVSDLIQNDDWHLTGNAGTTAGTNFLGTTDAKALMFKANGQVSGYISDSNTNTAGGFGQYKTTFGYQAGMGTAGDRVTAIGTRSGQNNTANDNTFIGYQSGLTNTSGINNTAIGSGADVTGTGLTNATAIGSNAKVGASNSLVLGGTGADRVNVGIGTATPASPLHIVRQNDVAYGTGIALHEYNNAWSATNNGGAIISTTYARGTIAAPTNLQDGDVVGTYNFQFRTNGTVSGGNNSKLFSTYRGNGSTLRSDFQFFTNAGVNAESRMTIDPDGDVGIGAINDPLHRLHVVVPTIAGADPVRFEGLQATGVATDAVVVATGTGVLRTVTAASLASSQEPWQVQGGTAKATTNVENIYQQGSVAIGITSGGSIPAAEVTANNPKLYVAGNVSATGSFITTTSKYADYVFEDYLEGTSTINKDYKFKSLEETAAYIKVNKHLPGVTAIKDILKTENGYNVNLSELSIQQLEKIEELYLHTIEQQQEISKQKTEISDLKSRMEKLEKLLLKENDNK